MQAARTPVPDAPPQDAAPATSATTARRIHLIINARSGLARHEQLGERARAFFQTRGIQTNVDLVHSGSQLHRVLERSRDGHHDVVIAAGGDGTISTVASSVADTGRVLGIIPVGTFNFFAQRIGVPLDVDQALGVIADGRIEKISVGEVNGRFFINNSSIGLYPTVLRQREATYRRVGRSRIAAYLSAAVALARRPAHMDLELVVDGTGLSRTTPLLFVGVNAHQLEAFGMQGVDCIRAGRLAMYITQPLGAPRLWKLGLAGLIKGFGDVPDLETVCGSDAVVSARRTRIRVAIDGELVRLHAPLRYRSRPDALRVIVPASGTEVRLG